ATGLTQYKQFEDLFQDLFNNHLIGLNKKATLKGSFLNQLFIQYLVVLAEPVLKVHPDTHP
ncbi:hypothetical protein VPJ49_18385, partial [Acinetobacter baumannii]|uniref:hypothetical protein n=1 Tax=Acinetobacter baumannii TaxID=470 RepID=UPI002FE3F039